METNVISLCKDDSYYYVDRATYNACILIENKYDLDTLINQFPNGVEERTAFVKDLYEALPSPINVLAAYTLLIEDELAEDLDLVISALHVITNSMSPYKYLTIPKEIRKDVSFSLNITAESELTTQMALSNMVSYDDVKEMLLAPKYSTQTNYSAPSKTDSPKIDYSFLDIPVEDLVIDDDTPIEVIRSHPDWVEATPGYFFHIETDECMVYEEAIPDLDEEEEKAFATTKTQESTSVPTQEVVAPSIAPVEDEKAQLTKIII